VVPAYEYGELVIKNYKMHLSQIRPTMFHLGSSNNNNSPRDLVFSKDVVFSEVKKTHSCVSFLYFALFFQVYIYIYINKQANEQTNRKECSNNTRMLIVHMLDAASLCIWSCMATEGNKVQNSLASSLSALGFRVEAHYLSPPPSHPSPLIPLP